MKSFREFIFGTN